jgi:hypothetical protein
MWYAITCSYDDWRRNYKRSHPAHSHQAEGQFVVDAKDNAVAEMAGSAQPRFAGVTTNQVATSGMRVKLPNDPGADFRQI